MGAPEAALRGALSGILAGAAMLLAEHIGEATDLARGPTVGRRWASRLGQRSPTLFSGALMSGFEAVSKR